MRYPAPGCCLRQHATCPFKVFVFALYERKNKYTNELRAYSVPHNNQNLSAIALILHQHLKLKQRRISIGVNAILGLDNRQAIREYLDRIDRQREDDRAVLLDRDLSQRL